MDVLKCLELDQSMDPKSPPVFVLVFKQISSEEGSKLLGVSFILYTVVKLGVLRLKD